MLLLAELSSGSEVLWHSKLRKPKLYKVLDVFVHEFALMRFSSSASGPQDLTRDRFLSWRFLPTRPCYLQIAKSGDLAFQYLRRAMHFIISVCHDSAGCGEQTRGKRQVHVVAVRRCGVHGRLNSSRAFLGVDSRELCLFETLKALQTEGSHPDAECHGASLDPCRFCLPVRLVTASRVAAPHLKSELTVDWLRSF